MILKAKKKLGQHFLINDDIAESIVENITFLERLNIVEVGPGEGALTKFLIKKSDCVKLVEIDKDAVDLLKYKFPKTEIINEDFLEFKFYDRNLYKYIVVGNFPYNISTQILFKVLENRNMVNELIGMFQKEVAERICSPPNSKKYGIPSVLLQAFYNCELLFDVQPENFRPAPKVNSTVIKLTRNNTDNLDCDYNKFLFVVKSSFLHRRKKLKNALKNFANLDECNATYFANKRAEELSVNDFIKLTKAITLK